MPHSAQATVTRLLEAVRGGERDALNDLFTLVYNELHAQARQQRRRWRGQYTVDTTALVHEAYIKLVDQTQIPWQNRTHFLGVAAQAMRHVLIDYARFTQRKKRGGDVQKVPLDDLYGELPDIPPMLEERSDDLVALDEAMQRLARINERQCRVVECRYFGGMTIPDTAEALAISPATVKRDWILAQAWLYREISNLNAG